MKLIFYQDEIDHFESGQPSDDKTESIFWIILELLKDESLIPYITRFPVPKESEKEKRDWLKTLLTLSTAGSNNEPHLRNIDALLASESLLEKCGFN